MKTVKIQFDHLFEVVSFAGRIVKTIGDRTIVAVPESVRSLPWYPCKRDDGTPYSGLTLPSEAVFDAVARDVAIKIN